MVWGSLLKNVQSAVENLSVADVVEKARVAARDVADVASKVSDTVQAEYRRTFIELDCQVFTVRPDLVVMEYPSDDKIERLATRLNADFSQRMLIFNMSERKYDTSRFQGEVVDVAFRGLPAPPVELIMELCISAQHWLEMDPCNIIIVHCFSGYSRSAVFLSCFMAFRGFCPHPVDALHEVCNQIGINDAVAIVPSQRRYLMYFQECQKGLSPTRKRLQLLRVQLNGVPRFETEGNVAFRPYIEVWNHGELNYTSFDTPPTPARNAGRTSSTAEDVFHEMPAGFSANDSCVVFQLPAIIVSGDVLIRVRHVYPNGSRDTALRLAFHTGFVTDGLQLAKRELDSACDDSRFPSEFFLDIIFEQDTTAGEANDDCTQKLAVFEKARELSKRLQEEERTWQATAKAAANDKARRTESDEVLKLEETLRQGPVFSGVSAASDGGSSGAVPEASDPAELQRMLAAAAADEEESSRVVLPPMREVRPEAHSPGSLAAETTLAPPPLAVAHSSGASKASSGVTQVETQQPAESLKDPITSSQDEIDQLFSDFDFALESVSQAGTSTTRAVDAKADSSRIPADDVLGAAPAQSQLKGTDDVFADVDAFLKELDG